MLLPAVSGKYLPHCPSLLMVGSDGRLSAISVALLTPPFSFPA